MENRARVRQGPVDSSEARSSGDTTFSYLLVEEYLDRRRRRFAKKEVEVPGHPDASLRLWLPRPASRRHETWVVIHGAGNDAGFGFWFLIEEALLAGIAVATWHLPGHGYGTRSGLSPRAARDRLRGVMRAIRAQREPEATPLLFLVGQSLGGALALDHVLPLRTGERSAAQSLAPAGVISVSPAVRIPELLPIHREFPGFLRRPVFETAFWIGPRRMLPALGGFRRNQFPVAFEALQRTRRSRAAAREAIQRSRDGRNSAQEAMLEDLGTGFVRVVRELDLPGRASIPLSAVAEAGAPPVLVLQGVRDGIIPVEYVREFETRLRRRRRRDFEFQYLPFNTHFDILVDRSVLRRMVAWTHSISRASVTGERRSY